MFATFLLIVIWGLWVALVAVPRLRTWQRKRAQRAAALCVDDAEARSLVGEAVAQMNSRVEWSKSGETVMGRFDFQSGHFSVRKEHESPYVQLLYPFFFETSLDGIELVRELCNQCNHNLEACRLLYTVDEAKGRVNLHVAASLLMQRGTAREVMERAMVETFTAQNIFVRRFNEQHAAAERAPGHDHEKAEASFEREVELLREQEMAHQDGGPDLRSQPDSPLPLGRLLSTAMGLTDVVPARLTVVRGGAVATIDDPDAALAYDFAASVWGEADAEKPKGAPAHLQLDYYDPRRPARLRHLMVDLRPDGATADTLYLRATIAVVPLAETPQSPTGSAETRRMVRSVLVGRDITPRGQRQDEFRYIWKEAMAKRKAGQWQRMTADETLLAQAHDERTGWMAYRGRALYLEHRSYEAALMLEGAWGNLRRHMVKDEQGTRDMYYEVCYLLGSCLSDLGQHDRAVYYLELTLPLHRVTYTEAFVNSMVAMGDTRTLGFIDSLLGGLQLDDDPSDSMTAFANFLMRRKASVLVGQGRLDEAEQLVRKLIDTPDSSDFALRFLARLRKLRERQTNEMMS